MDAPVDTGASDGHPSERMDQSSPPSTPTRGHRQVWVVVLLSVIATAAAVVLAMSTAPDTAVPPLAAEQRPEPVRPVARPSPAPTPVVRPAMPAPPDLAEEADPGPADTAGAASEEVEMSEAKARLREMREQLAELVEEELE